jgi:glycosyltransferase involved in cell wall biosynthesis
LSLARASDAVLAMTRAECDYLHANGVRPERLHVVGAGVNPAEAAGGDAAGFRRKHDLSGLCIAFISTATRDKGAIDLVEAVRLLWRSGRDVDLVVAGRSTAHFEHYLASLSPADRQRLRLIGFVSDVEKRDLLAAADIFAMPSRTDSFGIIYLEAWLNRVPVVAARAWGMADVIEDGRDGLLVPFGHPPALAEALGWLLDHPTARAEMGARGEQKVLAHHTWDRVYQQIRSVYEQLTGPI